MKKHLLIFLLLFVGSNSCLKGMDSSVQKPISFATANLANVSLKQEFIEKSPLLLEKVQSNMKIGNLNNIVIGGGISYKELIDLQELSLLSNPDELFNKIFTTIKTKSHLKRLRLRADYLGLDILSAALNPKNYVILNCTDQTMLTPKRCLLTLPSEYALSPCDLESNSSKIPLVTVKQLASTYAEAIRIFNYLNQEKSSIFIQSSITFATIDEHDMEIPFRFIKASKTLSDLVEDARSQNITTNIAIGSNISALELNSCIELWKSILPNCADHEQLPFFKIVSRQFSIAYLERLIDVANYLDLTELIRLFTMSLDNILVVYGDDCCLFPLKNYYGEYDITALPTINFITIVPKWLSNISEVNLITIDSKWLSKMAMDTAFITFKNNGKALFYNSGSSYSLDELISYLIPLSEGIDNHIQIIDPLNEYLVNNVTLDSLDWQAKTFYESLLNQRAKMVIDSSFDVKLGDLLLDNLLRVLLDKLPSNLCWTDNVITMLQDMWQKAQTSCSLKEKINFILVIQLMINFHWQHLSRMPYEFSLEQCCFFEQLLMTGAFATLKETPLATCIWKLIFESNPRNYTKLSVEFEKRRTRITASDSLQQACIESFLKQNNYFFDKISSSDSIDDLVADVMKQAHGFFTIYNDTTVKIVDQIAQYKLFIEDGGNFEPFYYFSEELRALFTLENFEKFERVCERQKDTVENIHQFYFNYFLCCVFIEKNMNLDNCIEILSSETYNSLPDILKKNLISFIKFRSQSFLNKNIRAKIYSNLTIDELSDITVSAVRNLLPKYSLTIIFANQESKALYSSFINSILLCVQRRLDADLLNFFSNDNFEQNMHYCNHELEQYFNFYLCYSFINGKSNFENEANNFESCYEMITSLAFKGLPAQAQDIIKDQMITFAHQNQYSRMKSLARSSSFKLKCIQYVRKNPKISLFLLGLTGGFLSVQACCFISNRMSQSDNFFLKKISNPVLLINFAGPGAVGLLGSECCFLDKSLLSLGYLLDNYNPAIRNMGVLASGNIVGGVLSYLLFKIKK